MIGRRVGHVDWRLEVEADAPQETIDELKEHADARRPGVYCVLGIVVLGPLNGDSRK